MAGAADRPLVLHIITGLGVGGAERMLVRTSALATRYRHEVCVLSSRGPVAAELDQAGIPVTALSANRGPTALFRLAKLRGHISRSAPAIIQSWLVHSNILAGLLAPHRIPLIWNVRHTLDGFDRERAVTRAAVRISSTLSDRCAAIIYNSGRAARQHEAIGYPAGRRVLIPNGFVTSEISSARRTAIRQSLGLSNTEVAIGLVARAHPIKNHEAFLGAARLIARDVPMARFVLAGTGTGPQEELARRWGAAMQGRLLWLGERSDITDVTAALDLAANVSYGEAFSNTLGEAMAAGVPCVATDVGESAQLVGGTGWLAPTPDRVHIEAAIRAALAASPDERARRGQAARDRIRLHYSLEAAAARFQDVYDGVAFGRTAGLI